MSPETAAWCRGLAAITFLICGSIHGAETPQNPPQAVPQEKFVKPWHVRLPREVMLAAWERLKAVEMLGVPRDLHLKVTGEASYVSPEGDDSSVGSKERPWKTLSYAAKQIKPNTVVYLMPGDYYGPASIRGVKGTEGAPAALRALLPGTVRVTYTEAFIALEKSKVGSVTDKGGRKVISKHDEKKTLHYPPLINVHGSTHIEISGLHLIGARDQLPHNLYSECGILFTGRAGLGCRVINNEIENVGHCGVKEQGHGGHSIIVEGNYIHDIGHTFHDHCLYFGCKGVIVRRNLLCNATGWGVHAYSTPAKMIITHNIMAGNDCHGVVLGGPDALVMNNVFYQNRRGGFFFFRSGCKNAIVKHNLFFEKTALLYDCCGWRKAYPSGNVADYNCLAPGTDLGQSAPQDSYGENNVLGDPLVFDADKFDFRLKKGSPCIDAGDKTVGKRHGKAPDIGLYEIK